MLFAIASAAGSDRPEFSAQLMAERLIARRASHPFPFLWVAMFRPVQPMEGAEIVLAVHYQPKSVMELEKGDWFTAREVRGFSEQAGWVAYRKLTSHRLDGLYIGPSQFVFEGDPEPLA